MADGAAAVASESVSAAAARELLARGNAADAVVAGIAAAAGACETVLLGSVQLLIGGIGSGLLAFDGRPRQPGRGAPRPRGFLAGEAVPDAARVAAPLLPATLATAIASVGSVSLRRVFLPALEIARVKSPERASVLDALSRRGAPALVEGFVASELLAVAGRATGGLLTTDDLRSMRPRIARCEGDQDPAGMVTVPWFADTDCDASSTQVVAAMDSRGMVAIACYEAPPEGVAVRALGLAAPTSAAPVMRGKTRVAPGVPRPSAAPIALRANRGAVDLAIGVSAAADAQGILRDLSRKLAAGASLATIIGAIGEGKPVALLRTDRSTRAIGG